MPESNSDKTTFHLDHEHRGLRYTVILILFLSFAAGFLIANALLRRMAPALNTTVILSCLAAIPICLAASALGEWYLKRNWHSGRSLRVGPEQLTLRLSDGSEQHIDRQKHMNLLWWHVPLTGYARGGRERRIPSKWHCVSGQLQQDDVRIVVFCYANPKRWEVWRTRFEFEMLRPEDVYNTSFSGRFGSPDRPELPADVIAGKQGRHWLAERNRWRNGLEMTQEDFEQLMQLLRRAETQPREKSRV